MLPLIALTVLQGKTADPQPPRLKSPAEVARFLKGIGFDYRPTSALGDSGKLTHNKRTADELFLEFSGYDPHKVKGHVNWLRLKTTFDVARELKPLPDPPFGLAYVVANSVYLQPSIGRTVTAYADINVERDLTPIRVKAELLRFWTAVEAYATANGGQFKPAKKRDWSRERFDESFVPQYVDATSMDRLLQAWGWSHPKGNYYPILDGQRLHGMVEGEEIDIDDSGGYDGKPAILTLGAQIDSEKLPGYVKGVPVRRPEIGWGTLKSMGYGDFEVTQTIDLSSGVRLGDLRRRIGDFAKNVRELKKQMVPPPPSKRS